MIVLSLFDGMSCGRLALERAGIPVTKYYASEIDKYAIQVSQKNWPDVIQLGDVTNWREWDIETPDLIIGGSPCQGFSFAGKQLAFDDSRSRLFFTMMDIIGQYNPRFKLLENVKMKKEYLDVITEYMGVEPMFINSALVSSQNRQRYYWFNWDAPMPKDKGIRLIDVIDSDSVEKTKIVTFNNRVKSVTQNDRGYRYNRGDVKKTGISELGRILKPNAQKTDALTTSHPPKIALNSDVNNLKYRKLTPVECERLQTLPDNYTEGVSNTQRYKMLGNGWTVDVVAHLFKSLPIN